MTDADWSERRRLVGKTQIFFFPTKKRKKKKNFPVFPPCCLLFLPLLGQHFTIFLFISVFVPHDFSPTPLIELYID